ncbi:hypothetical protein Clacol_003700 [Clathrus columnatus]|uniref:Uncharacterized protein n=1 Tax=Clathrus columnatus TaxID=1419009 RepID=A0AAV5A7J3_9AGAM|nr:hypothetical protein Clacol_003700 [Clathrus columnatus]
MLRIVVARRVSNYSGLLVRWFSLMPPPSYSQLLDSTLVSDGSIPSDIVPQAPNRTGLWSTSQRLRPKPNSDPRFEQTVMDLQPAPLSAMELINDEPIRLVEGRRAVCDGVIGPLRRKKKGFKWAILGGGGGSKTPDPVG